MTNKQPTFAAISIGELYGASETSGTHFFAPIRDRSRNLQRNDQKVPLGRVPKPNGTRETVRGRETHLAPSAVISNGSHLE